MNGLENLVKYKTGSKLVVEALEEFGITKIFGYPGACILSLYNELADRQKIFHCLCRHEQACVHAAEGYARISGEVGVVLVTSGPGATNTVTGIADAYADCTPLLVLAGAPNETEGKIFQNVDFVSMIKTSVKKVFTPSLSDNLYDVVFEALKTANSGKKGPVVIQLTRAVLENNYEVSTKNLNSFVKDEKLDLSVLEQLKQLLKASKSPLFLVGGGASDSFKSITKLACHMKINTVTTLMGVGNVSTEIPYYCGMIGVNGVESANDALFKSDLIVAFGVAFSDRTTCKSELFANGIPVVNINLESYEYDNVNIVLEVNKDCNLVLQHLLQDYPVEFEVFSKSSSSFYNNKGMGTEDVLECINSYTKEFSPIVITDVGQHQMFAAQKFDFTKPKRFLTSGGLGTMGFGLPAACGAHFAEPDACIINITGDGSFQMNIQELATVKEYQIPVKIFVMNNGYLGMIRQTQEKFYGGKYYQSKMVNPDFITLAKGYDIKGYRVSSIEQLNGFLPEIFSTSQPIIVDCITNQFETV